MNRVQHHLQLPFKIQMGINTKSIPSHLNRLSPPLALGES